MLQNAYFLAKIGADTAENEQHSAEILPKTGNYPTGPAGGTRTPRPSSALRTVQILRPGCIAGRTSEASGRCEYKPLSLLLTTTEK